MIVKLTKMGGFTRYIEADNVYEQPVMNGRVDLEIIKHGGPVQRIIIGEEDSDGIWNRAYIMEHGKTVDTIRSHSMPIAKKEITNRYTK